MNIVLLDAKTLGSDLDLSPLHELGDVIAYPSTEPDEVADRLSRADVALINKIKLNAKTLGEAKNLKLVCIAATGYDNVDLEYMKNRGIGVCNVVGYSTASVAQLTLAMALSLSTHLSEFNDFVKSGEYTESRTANRLTPVYHELEEKTWGIVGLGNIGKKVAQIAEAMGCRVICVKRTDAPGYTRVDIDTLCRESDIISIHTPLNRETEGMISAERIAKMKNTAILINVARGAVCNEGALCKAVREGKLGGIGVDVYTEEPFGLDSPYYTVKDLPNVCLTPHMAWGAAEARQRCLNDIAENIKAFMRGDKRSRLV